MGCIWLIMETENCMVFFFFLINLILIKIISLQFHWKLFSTWVTISCMYNEYLMNMWIFSAVKLLFSQVTMYQDPNKHCTVKLNTSPETDTNTAQTWFTACSLLCWLCCYPASWWSQGQDLLPPPQTFRTRLMLFWLRKTTPLCTLKVIWFKSCIEIDCNFLIRRN